MPATETAGLCDKPSPRAKPANDNATPSPSPRGRHRLHFSDWIRGFLMDSTPVRQPHARLPLRVATLPRALAAEGLRVGPALALGASLALDFSPLFRSLDPTGRVAFARVFAVG